MLKSCYNFQLLFRFGEEDILTVSDESEAQKKDEACERSPRSVGVAPCGSDEDGVKKTQCLICMVSCSTAQRV